MPSDRRGAQGNDPAAGQDWVISRKALARWAILRPRCRRCPARTAARWSTSSRRAASPTSAPRSRADSLRPTQREFSRKKVQQARQDTGAAKTVVVSGDGYALTGNFTAGWRSWSTGSRSTSCASTRRSASCWPRCASSRHEVGRAADHARARRQGAGAGGLPGCAGRPGALMSRYTCATMQPEELAAPADAGEIGRRSPAHRRHRPATRMQWVREACGAAGRPRSTPARSRPRRCARRPRKAEAARHQTRRRLGCSTSRSWRSSWTCLSLTPARLRQMVKIDRRPRLTWTRPTSQVPPRALPDAHPLLTPTTITS